MAAQHLPSPLAAAPERYSRLLPPRSEQLKASVSGLCSQRWRHRACSTPRWHINTPLSWILRVLQAGGLCVALMAAMLRQHGTCLYTLA